MNGEQFTSEKLTIQCGATAANKATLDVSGDPYILTLDNAVITEKYSDAGIYAANKKVNIVLKGTNKIELADATLEESNNIGINL